MPHFYQTIEYLRLHEKILLFGNQFSIVPEENQSVMDFLQLEFEKETLEYPTEFPKFDPSAALWGAQVTYAAAQLILFRGHKDQELPKLIPAYQSPITPEAILSADLCLRFLPDLLHQILEIDSADPLVELLESFMKAWHYSGMRYDRLDVNQLKFDSITNNPALFQLYCWRIIKQKKVTLAEHPVFNESISALFGLYSTEFWSTFKRINLPTLV